MSRISRRQPGLASGFTLIELVIVIVIIGIVGGILTNVMVQAYNAFMTGQQLNNVVAESRFINSRLKIDLEQATPSNIITASNNTFEFTNDNGVKITYTLASNRLTRAEDDGTAFDVTTHMGTGVADFSFNYYEADGVTATMTIADIRYISVVTNLKEASSAGWDIEVPTRLSLYLRNTSS